LATYKSAFIQYQRHKEDSRLESGLILFSRRGPQNEGGTNRLLQRLLQQPKLRAIIDAPGLKEEYRGLPFPEVLDRLINRSRAEAGPASPASYPLKLVISLLQQHVSELMETVSLSDPEMMRVITDRKLLSGLGRLDVRKRKK